MHHPLSKRGVVGACFDLIVIILGVVFWMGHFVVSFGPLSGQTETSIVVSHNQLRLTRNWFSVPLDSLYLSEKPAWFRTTAICVDYGRTATHEKSDWGFLGFHAMHDVISENSAPAQEISELAFPVWFNGALILIGVALLSHRFYRYAHKNPWGEEG